MLGGTKVAASYSFTNKISVSEKIAVFVSDGIRYTLKGRVSVDTMKTIVDTMK